MMIDYKTAWLCVFIFQAPGLFAQQAMVCGDSKIILIDYGKSTDTIPVVAWTWDAHEAQDLPETYREKKFNSVDDCKAIDKGRKILVSSSSGAVAILDSKSRKALFYADVPNAHSVEILPGNRLAAAASTAAKGNRIMLFDAARPDRVLFEDSLYSAHGLVWHKGRKTLFALGYDVLREYRLTRTDSLVLSNSWKIPGISGHDLYADSKGDGLFMTEHTGVWRFDLKTYRFEKIEGFPDTENIKSIGRNKSGQFIYTVPEKSWWTYHVSFFHPEKKLAFPGMRVYKARWFGD